MIIQILIFIGAVFLGVLTGGLSIYGFYVALRKGATLQDTEGIIPGAFLGLCFFALWFYEIALGNTILSVVASISQPIGVVLLAAYFIRTHPQNSQSDQRTNA